MGSDKPYLQSADRLFGASPYERILQHEGALVVGYRIPSGDETPFANLHLPKGTAWVARGDWLFGDMGGFHVGLRPFGAYHWERIRESRNDAIMLTEAELIDGWLLRIAGPNPGLALAAVEADDVPSFADFQVRRTEVDVNLSAWERGGRVRMKTTGGVELDLTWDGVHRIDGRVVDYEAWPLYEAPGTWAAAGMGRMRFAHGDEAMEVDFELDPDAELLPMRVVG